MDSLTDWLGQIEAIGPSEEDAETDRPAARDRIDLFGRVIPALERGDINFFKKLSDSERETVEPWIIMRWATSPGTDHEQVGRLYLVNELVNRNFQILSPKKTLGIKGHPELQWMTLAMACRGSVRNYKFISPPRATRRTDPLAEYLYQRFPSWRESDLELFLRLNQPSEVEDWLRENGLSDREIKNLTGKR